MLDDFGIDYDLGQVSQELELFLTVEGVGRQVKNYSKTAGEMSVNLTETRAAAVRQSQAMPLRWTGCRHY